MNLTPGTPKFDFVAEVKYIAETKLKANLYEDADGWLEMLWTEYKSAGSRKEMKKWIMARIKGEFRSMEKPPAWVDFDSSLWPFHKDKPMMLIAQIPLKGGAETKDVLWGGAVAYVFGMRDKGEHGEVIMVYREVTLCR